MSTHGVQVDMSDSCKPHWDLAKEKDIIDFDLGAKVTGAGFPFYKGKGAKLQRGLIEWQHLVRLELVHCPDLIA